MKFLPLLSLVLAFGGNGESTVRALDVNAKNVPTEAPRELAANSDSPVGSDAPFWSTGTYDPKDDCADDTHQYVMWKLNKVFVEKNCVWNYDWTVSCYVEVPGWSVSRAEYTFEDSNCNDDIPYQCNAYQPVSLVITNSLPGSSLREEIEFDNRCMDDLKYILRDIEYQRENPDENPYNPSNAPFPAPPDTDAPSVVDPCANSKEIVSYGRKKEISCNELGGLKWKSIKNKCKKFPQIAEACPGICKIEEKCECENNPVAFPLGRSKTFSCSDLVSMKPSKLERKCSNKKILLNCRSICDADNCS